MSESRFNQLRFDISEKVRLHPQQPGIGTLLELDLYPDVEIRDEGKHLKIQGYLRLNGAYLGDVEGAQVATVQAEVREELAYVIPVEITIPADRAELDNISAEVETFDYSVVSPFELQVEAILAIDGLVPEEKKEKKVPKKAVTHDTTPKSNFAAKPVAPAKEDVVTTQEEQPEPVSEFKEFLGTPHSQNEDDDKTGEDSVLRPELHFQANREEEESLEVASQEPSSVDYLHSLWNKRKTNNELSADEQFAQDQFAMEKEMEQNPEKAPMLHSKNRGQDAQWVGWLMRSNNESFTSMRMVISQKDESIDTIADKYGLPAGQLMSINNLQDVQLDEGQIIYIPRKLQRTS